MKNGRFTILVCAVIFVMAGTAYSFDLGGFVKELEKSSQQKAQEEKIQKPSAQPENQPSQPSSNQGGGGLIGLGESLGVFDKKTSNILKQSVNTLQALQPIRYEEEKAIGGSLAVEVFNKFGGPYQDPKLQSYITLVGQAVADVSERPDIPYHFAILNTEDPNAFATPGGYVFVSIGLLRMLKNEAQLAGVLGHEIAHITQKHAIQTLERSKSLKGLSSLTMTVMDKDPGLFDKVINEVSNILFTRGLDHNLEYEADKFGTEYAYRTGYFPGGLKDFLKILGQSQSKNKSIFMSTHPSLVSRFKRLTSTMRSYKSALLSPVLTNRFQSRTKGHL
ncbi:MAG: M48 family metalloprotease [Nitrospinota bacterium]|nr:M48 family metalloprotease [Nitrospinota bacterium]